MLSGENVPTDVRVQRWGQGSLPPTLVDSVLRSQANCSANILLKDVARRRPNVVPLTNDSIVPTNVISRLIIWKVCPCCLVTMYWLMYEHGDEVKVRLPLTLMDSVRRNQANYPASFLLKTSLEWDQTWHHSLMCYCPFQGAMLCKRDQKRVIKRWLWDPSRRW